MDTSDFVASKALKTRHAGTAKLQRAGKRGQRSTKQKRRQATKLEKALAFAGRLDSKAAQVEPLKQSKKLAKSLWAAD